jgi:hypothetical protein
MRKRRFSMLGVEERNEEWHILISPAGALAGIGDVHAKAHIANASAVEKNADTKAAMIKAISQLKDF